MFYVNGTVISMQGSSDTEDDSSEMPLLPRSVMEIGVGCGEWNCKKFNASLVSGGKVRIQEHVSSQRF